MCGEQRVFYGVSVRSLDGRPSAASDSVTLGALRIFMQKIVYACVIGQKFLACGALSRQPAALLGSVKKSDFTRHWVTLTADRAPPRDAAFGEQLGVVVSVRYAVRGDAALRVFRSRKRAATRRGWSKIHVEG